jgi:hypothetical protein
MASREAPIRFTGASAEWRCVWGQNLDWNCYSDSDADSDSDSDSDSDADAG